MKSDCQDFEQIEFRFIMASQEIPDIASEAVLVRSETMPDDSKKVTGYDFNQGVDHHALLQSYLTSGFQATNFGLAVEQIKSMVHKLLASQIA